MKFQVPIALLILGFCLQPVSSEEEELEIVVVGRRENPSPSAVSLTPETIRRSVGTGNDLNRVLAADPSVYAVGTMDDNSLIVRGGLAGENVYILDGIELNTINHFADRDLSGGGLGFVNTDLVSGIDFYKGGGSAAMPARISSAVDIRLRDRPESGRHYQCDLNTSGLGATFERGMLDDRVYLLSNLRWVDTRLVRQWLGDKGAPVYGDGLLKAVFRIDRQHTLSLLGLFSRDVFLGPSEPSPDLDYSIPTQYQEYLYQYALGFSEKYADSVVRNTLSVSAVSMDGGRYRDHQAAMDTVSVSSVVSRRMYTKAYINRYEQVSDDFSLNLTRNAVFECGVYGQYSTYSYYNQHSYYRYSQADTAVDGYQAGGYTQGSVKYKRLAAKGGLRTDYYSLIRKTGASPRMEISFGPSVNHRLWINGGLYHQLPAKINAMLPDLLWPEYRHRERPKYGYSIQDLALQRCWQGNLGYERGFGPLLSMKIETYCKWYDREYPFIAPEEAYYDTCTQVEDGEPVLRISQPNGKKRSVGFELTFKNAERSGWPCSISGFVSSVRNQYIDSLWYNDKNDVQAGARVSAGRNFGRHHRLAATFCAMRGRPEVSGEDKYYSRRLDPLFLLNLRYSAEYEFCRTLFRAYIDIVNVLNQTPVVDQFIDDRGRYSDIRLEGIFPVLGLTVQF